MEKLEKLQWKIEEGILNESRATFVNSLETLSFTDTKLGTPIFNRAYTKVIKGMREWFRTHKIKDRGINLVLSLSEQQLSIISTKFVLDQTFSSLIGGKSKPVNNSISSLSIRLGRRLLQQFNFWLYYGDKPGLLSYLRDYLKEKTAVYRSRTMKWWKEKGGQKDLTLDTKDITTLGYYMLKIVVESSGLFEVIQKYSQGKTMNVVVPSKAIMTKVYSHLNVFAEAHPVMLPMVVPPLPWTTYDDGGYLGLKALLVATSQKTNEELWAINGIQPRLPEINYLQRIQWKINKGLIPTLEDAYTHNHPCVPLADLSFIAPERPWRNSKEYLELQATCPQVIKEYKKAYAHEYTKFFNSRTKGRRLSFLRTLSIAKRFQYYETIWFPWKMDYRGRYYPLASGLNPQADDVGKALLLFKEEAPVTRDNIHWLKHHLAGLMGYDKVSQKDRQVYINSNLEIIHRIAEDYRSHDWWHEADKPWCALATIRELSAILKGEKDTCGIPIALDGSCNGLQHLSAAVRDEVTGSLVNLIPHEVPADIYTEVAKVTDSLLPNHSPFKGNVSRKLVKRNTMTTPYNVTLFGMREQVVDELMSKLDRVLTKQERLDAFELAQTNHQAIVQLLGTSIELMVWYSKVVKAYVDKGLPILWELPDGFKVLQKSPILTKHKVELERRKVVVRYMTEKGGVDIKKAQSSFAPNVTHSMDATHMSMVIRSIRENFGDIPFAPIHDSFGAPLHLVDPIGETIRKTFVSLYSTYDIIKWFIRDYKEKTGEDLPEPPVYGRLDLNQVYNSVHSFN